MPTASEIAGSMLNDSINGIKSQWDKGQPYRVALGALLSGDPATAKQAIEEHFKDTKPSDIYQGAMNAGMGFAPIGMAAHTVYHGSPYNFDKFAMEKIGTGEGVQAYGHGIYQAESPKVAKEYLKVNPQTLLPPNRVFQGQTLQAGTPEYHAGTLLDNMGLQQARKTVAGWIQEGSPDPNLVPQWQKTLDTLNSASSKQDFKTVKNVPNLYKSDIPDSSLTKMLDWDKPLSEQHPDVQSSLGSLQVVKNDSPAYSDERWLLNHANSGHTLNSYPTKAEATLAAQSLTGGDLVKSLDSNGAAFGSKFLQSQGIPGIRYLDGGSRANGEGTSNFVMFNPDDIRILEKNGVPTGQVPWDK